jgi:Fe-only nitrogenase accessory protein AnfO
MAKEIAVFIGADGTSASLDEPGKIVVYRRAQGSWEPDRERDFSIGRAGGMRELRQKMSEVLQFLGGCRVFVARSAAGVPYLELEKAGHSVWEFGGRPAGFLEHVWAEEERERAAEQTPAAAELPVPEETSPGNFLVNIRDIQGNSADLTSKQVLRPFIAGGGFRSLAILCSHVPPWIEVEALHRGLGFETEQQGRHEFPPVDTSSPPPQDAAGRVGEEPLADVPDRQTSHKAGAQSLGQKLDATKYPDRSMPQTHAKPGAFGHERAAGPHSREVPKDKAHETKL